jgi:hypothetical protein
MSADGAGGAGGGAMQFDRVEPAIPGEARGCRICKRPIVAEYFQIAQTVVCGSCAGSLSGSKEGRGLFLRALLYGVGAALLGTLVWFAIIEITNHEFGLLAIGIGLFVGVAVRRGGRGLGGWRYQALAMVLTYVSITGAYVPLVVKELAAAGEAKKAAASNPGGDAAAQAPTAGAEGGAPQAARVEHGGAKPGPGTLLLGLAAILGLAFAAPFLAGASNIMGIIIIGIGLYEAWKINRRIPLSGPFRFGAATAAVAAAPGGGAPPPAVAP